MPLVKIKNRKYCFKTLNLSDLLFISAASRLVLNIEGEESVPSDQWSFSDLEKRQRLLFKSPIDPFYHRSIPVMTWSTEDTNSV